MPRTPAPLTVEFRAEHDGWLVLAPAGYEHGGKYIATFAEEADARAFVALPALVEAATHAESRLRRFAGIFNGPRFTDRYGDGHDFQAVADELAAALAAADGPSPKE